MERYINKGRETVEKIDRKPIGKGVKKKKAIVRKRLVRMTGRRG